MTAGSPTFEVERSRHWITDVELSPSDADPNCKFSARVFVDNDLVCDLPWIDCTRSLQWSGLLLCDVSPLSKVSFRLCRSVQGKHKYFNFPRFFVSEVDEETGESTLELPEAAWVVTIKSLKASTAEQRFQGELENFNATEDPYGGLETQETIESLFKYALRFAAFVVQALPESTAKVSFLIFMKAWELLDQQTQLGHSVQAVLRSLTRIRDIIDVASRASSLIFAPAMNRSKEPIKAILALLEDVSLFIFNRHTTNYLARISSDDGESRDTFDVEAYLARLEDLQKAFYDSWYLTGVASPVSSYGGDNEPVDASGYNVRTPVDQLAKADWYEISNLMKPLNPSGYDPNRACLAGTREAVLNKIIDWTQNRENSETFMWISGQVGMGKTSIATSLCQRLDSVRALAGSFFCQRGDFASCDPLTLITNLVCDMSMNCPTYAHEVANAIRSNPKLSSAQLGLRYRGLVKRPLKQLKYITMPSTMVVIIDGLDECGDSETRGQTLRQLCEMSRLVPWLKVIITASPVGDLQQNFQANCPHGTVVRLQDYDAASDIRAYMTGQLGRLAATERWPSDSIVRLCTMAQGVFLWATLATKYIKKSALQALSRLQKVLDNRKSPVTDHFDALHIRALQTAIADHEDESRDDYLRCVGSILVTSERELPTSPDLQHLLLLAGQADQLTLDQILKDLAPLLLIVDGGDIRFLHPSFKDFVSDSSRSGGFHLQLNEYEVDPAASCLKLMQRDLRFNICNLETSHLLNSQVPDLKTRIQSNISPTLEYACIRWVEHFVASPSRSLVEAVREFLEGPQLMYWIEVLSLLGRLDVATNGLLKLSSLELNQFDGWSLIIPWIKDAHRFLLSFYDAISASAPHLYVSALAFAPSKSPTAHRMRPYFPNTLTITKDPGLAWHPCVKTIAHPYTVQTLSVSPNGLEIVVGYPDGSLAIWDLQTGARIGELLVGHDDSIASVTHSPNGDLIASGSYDTTIRVWSVVDQFKSSHVLAGHSGVVYAVAFSPDATIIASGSSDKTIWLWDPKTMCPIHGPYVGHSSSVSSLAFSPDGTQLVSGSWDNTIRVWSVALGGQQLADNPLLITGHSDPVNCVAFSPDGSRIASGSTDKTVKMWHSQTGEMVESCTSLTTHSDSVASITFSPNGDMVASSSLDGAIMVRDATTLEDLGCSFGHPNSVEAISFSPNGDYVVSGSSDMTTRVWEIVTRLKPMNTAPLVGHTSPVYCVAISSDGTRIISGSGDHTVRMWDAQTGAPVGKPYVGHTSYVYGVAFCLDGTRAVSGSIDMTLKLWDTTKNTLVGSYQHQSKIRCIAASFDGSLIAFGSDDEQVYLWDPKARKIHGPLEGHNGLINSVAFSPDGAVLASASAKSVILWDTGTLDCLSELITGHARPIRSVAFSPCGTQLVSGSDDNMVRVWDVKTGNQILELVGHSNHVVAVAVSPDGSCIASASFDNTIRLWNSKTGQMIGQPLIGHSKRLRCITFSNDGSYLVSGSDDNGIRVWSLDAYLTQTTDKQRVSSWPANPYELLPHPQHPGWVTHDQQSLAFWLPPHCQQPERFLSARPQIPSSHSQTFLDYSTFVHGTAWTAVASDSVVRSSG